MTNIHELKQLGFLQTKQIENFEIFHISTPCVFRIESEIVQSLKEKYISTEEIGGVLCAKPTLINNERFYIIDSVSYVRNAIEDNPRNDALNKSNAYYPDKTELNQALITIFKNNCLPIKFQTHTTKGKEDFESEIIHIYKTKTSEHYKSESEHFFNVVGTKLLMPRCLIVGNSLLDIFIGIYGGFIPPAGFTGKVNEKIKETVNILHFAGTNPEERKKIETEQEAWRTVNAMVEDKQKALEKALKVNEELVKQVEELKRKLDEKN